MRPKILDRLIHSLLCVRLGQELGSSSDASQAVAGAIETVVQIVGLLAR
jgi:hypothetical protein